MQRSSSSIRALIFDYGGVLMRTKSQEPRRRLACRLGMTTEELYRTVFDNEVIKLAEVGQMSAQQLGREIGARLGLRSDEEIGQFWGEFFGGDVLDTGLVAQIRRWRRTYKTALLSNFAGNLHDHLRDKLGIAHCFDEIIISAQVGLRKPDPRIYELAAERLQVEPHEAVFVDDMAVNVKGAQSVGMHAIHFTSPKALLAELDRLLGQDTCSPETGL
jgi:putative hydrolase of the HAD superfamily